MDERNERYWELLARYLKNEISEEEKTTLLDWVEQDPENKEVFYRASHLWHLTGKARDAFQPDVDKAWQRFEKMMYSPVPAVAKEETDTREETKVLPLTGKSETRIFSTWIRVAAVFLVMVGIGYGLYISNSSENVQIIAQAADEEKKDFYLPDGSHVFLNRHSSISYEKDLEGEQRIVHLKGEAFFDVKRNPKRPFVIYTSQSRVEVLGTSFTVREDTLKKLTEVDVVTGKVAFSSLKPADTTRLYLRPGYRGILQAKQGLQIARIEDPNFRAWQVDKLVFDNTRLSSVVPAMEAYFGVTIEVQNPQLWNCRYTGDFEKPALETILKVLAEATNLQYRYEKQSDRYILFGGGCMEN